MVKSTQILFRSLACAVPVLALWGCGQRGPLYLPNGPEAQQRATLPETLNPTRDTPPLSPVSAEGL